MNKNWILVPLSLMVIGCGSSSNTKSTKGSIDISTYLESKTFSKEYQKVTSNRGQAIPDKVFTSESIVTTNQVERKTANITQSIIKIEANRIINTSISSEGNTTTLINRYVNTGDKLYFHDINTTKLLEENGQNVGNQTMKGFRTCELLDTINEFTHKSHTYTGDIIKVFCTVDVNLTTSIDNAFIATSNYTNGSVDVIDTFYVYNKKDTGLIAKIDDDCLPNAKSDIPNDYKQCTDENTNSEYMYFLEN